jgi:hypothetical protein
MQTAYGAWEPVAGREGPPPRLGPSLRVPMDQPLARLAFLLLEPRSDDGVVAWSLLPALGDTYPVVRIP